MAAWLGVSRCSARGRSLRGPCPTRQRRRWHRRRHLDRLTPAHVQQVVRENRNVETSRGTPPSPATLRHVYKLVRNALGDAYRMELVSAIAVRGTMKAALMSPPPLTNEAPTSRLLVRALSVAVSTSALGGTRTPNLLIRRRGCPVSHSESNSEESSLA